MPRVSVVIPVWNAGKLLRDALNSIAAQTYRDVETIIVDDGSTDATTRDVLDEAAGRADTTVIRTATRGPAAARNAAIAQATMRRVRRREERCGRTLNGGSRLSRSSIVVAKVRRYGRSGRIDAR